MYISLNISLSRLQYKNNAFLPLREIVQVYNTYITGDRCHKSTVFLKSGLSEKTSTAVLIRIASELRCFFGGEGGIRTHVPRRATAFRVFYSEHTLADFEKKCPILRVNALVRKKWLPSPFWLLPTVRNARELSERTNRTAIKHNNRKSP